MSEQQRRQRNEIFCTGKVYEGGAFYEVEAAMDTLPVFLREGRQEYLIGKI